MIIAFIGNDGSGKTTLAKKFGEKLRVLGFNIEYKAEFHYFLLSHFLRFLGKEKVSRARKLFLAEENKQRKPFYFKAWPYLVWFDLFLEQLWNKLFKRNSIVIMDRYAFDFLMSWEWLGYANAYIRWLYVHFPKPNLAFILDVSPLTAYQRKRETHIYPLYYYEVQRKRYLNLAKTLRIRVINTEKTVEECLREVINELRRCFISKLSDEDKVLLFYSFPKFNPSMLQELSLGFDWSSLNWDYVLDMAIKCSTENVLCKNLLRYHRSQLPRQVSELLSYVLEKSNERVELLVRTLKVISRKLGEKKIPFLVMKTIAPFDYSATDVDILVRKEDFERAQEALSSIFNISKRSRMHKALTYQGDLLPVDLHYEISWLGIKVVDEEEVFERKRKILYKSVELFVPSLEDELLILCAHSLFQYHYTTLGEFLRVTELASNDEVDKEYVLNASRNYGWQQTLQLFLPRLLWRYNLIYGTCYIFSEINAKRKFYSLGGLIFFHQFRDIPRKNLQQVLDLLLTFFRWARFKLSGQLAYNTNWLKVR